MLEVQTFYELLKKKVKKKLEIDVDIIHYYILLFSLYNLP